MGETKRYIRKRQSLMAMVGKIKLWPSRSGMLHGVKEIRQTGPWFEIEAHCGLVFKVRDSANSRAARWLRAKQYVAPCPKCRVPGWKLDKFGATVFSKRQGQVLTVNRPAEPL
ncbi:MAG: hypothetical protein LBU12_00725 [Deltaproteobacteria bacterium]|jgi:pyrrolysyl-tRNA synthetase-like protein|nr:hypothetical protein [Deltaproteobacteria bacterium]